MFALLMLGTFAVLAFAMLAYSGLRLQIRDLKQNVNRIERSLNDYKTLMAEHVIQEGSREDQARLLDFDSR